MTSTKQAAEAYAANPTVENLTLLNQATALELAKEQLAVPERKKKQEKSREHLIGNKFNLQLADKAYATIYAARQVKGFSQTMVATLLNVSRVHVNRVQNGLFVHASKLLDDPAFQAEIEAQARILEALPEATKAMLKQQGKSLYWTKKD